MATILILTHEYDGFSQRGYFIQGLFPHWERMGHRIVVAEGIPPRAEADIVFLHIDVSVVPDEYIEFAAQFPVVVNRAARDIRKSAVSRFLVRPGDRWAGAVMVKSDFNTGGASESLHNLAAALRNRPPPYPTVRVYDSYPIYQSINEVPEAVWNDANLVVERFLPEQDKKGYWRRVWRFCGDKEICNRYCAPIPAFTGTIATDREQATVPDELRAERKRLGFDYGKFDFVIHRGKVVLFDANRTPAASGGLDLYSDRSFGTLASGINSLLGAARN
jgi:hypothetical protein